MASLALSIALLACHASAITLDWNTLTDFTAHYQIDMHNIVVAAKKTLDCGGGPGSCRELPYTKATEKGIIQADIPNEKVRIASHGATTLSEGNYDVDPALWGSSLSGSGELVIDGGAGLAAIRAKFSGTWASRNNMALGPAEFCVKVNLPPQAFPPKQVVQAGLAQGEQMVNAQMGSLPPHTSTTIDGEQVEVFAYTSRYALGALGRHGVYLGLRENGAPFGFGMLPPVNGEWHPMLKFPSWQHGAGDIEAFDCAGHGSSASALVEHPEGSRLLDVFDDLLARIRTPHSMDTAFASFPQRPSELFRQAAAMESNVAEHSMASDVHYTPVIVVAGVAGAFGAFVGLAVMKLAKQWSTSSRREALLSNMA